MGNNEKLWKRDTMLRSHWLPPPGKRDLRSFLLGFAAWFLYIIYTLLSFLMQSQSRVPSPAMPPALRVSADTSQTVNWTAPTSRPSLSASFSAASWPLSAGWTMKALHRIFCTSGFSRNFFSSPAILRAFWLRARLDRATLRLKLIPFFVYHWTFSVFELQPSISLSTCQCPYLT